MTVSDLNKSSPAVQWPALSVEHKCPEETPKSEADTRIAQQASSVLPMVATCCATPPVNPDPDFSSWTYKVKDIPELLKRLGEKGTSGKSLVKELGVAMKQSSKEYRKKNPRSIADSTRPEFKGDVHRLYPAYDDIRVLKDHPELGYVNASYIKTPGQNWILACCPQTEREAAAMFFALFNDPSDHQVWVAVHALNDGQKEGKEKRLCNDFTSDDVLSRLQFPDGWKITHVERKPPVKGTIPATKEGETSSLPFIAETEILATDGKRTKKITCLRYHQWEDHHVVPDEDLCIQLVDRTFELCPDKVVDKIVNCVGGVGRSGMFLLLYSLWNEIKAQATTMPIDEVSFNLPQMVLKLRKDRMCLLDNLSHLAPMARILQKLVAREKNTQVGS